MTAIPNTEDERGSARTAIETAASQALEGAGGAEGALVFVTPGSSIPVEEIVDVVGGVLGTDALAGATSHGVIGAGQEIEGQPSLSILALRGLECMPFLLPDLRADGVNFGEDIAGILGGQPGPGDLIVLLPDANDFDPEAVLPGIRTELDPARVVGAGSAAPGLGSALQWGGRQVESGALAGLILRAPGPVTIGVTQSCRPVTPLLTVTRAQGHWLLELDGRPALDVYREVARAPLAEDLRHAAAFLLAAIPRDERDPLRPGGYLARNVAGFDEEHRALAIPEILKPGQHIALATREPEGAREDLKEMLAGAVGAQARLGMLFDCCARGASLFGMPGLEAAYLENALGQTPAVGMFGAFELGPIGSRDGAGLGQGAAATELLTYTGVLALLEA
ncbi:FIST C-terminal domain-containing protein [Myxococcota bacterium]|nr:FIST C-terminal domain-containing protein [Myxococcota bacterium]